VAGERLAKAQWRRWRKELIALWQRVGAGSTKALPHPRVAVVLLRQCVRLLLTRPGQQIVRLSAQTIAHGAIHRHLIVIRCPDQPFYLDAVRDYLLRRRLAPLAQQTIVLGMRCDAAGCALELKEPGEDPSENFILAALHISANDEPDRARLVADLRAVLAGVHASVRDFATMQRRLRQAAEGLRPQAAEEAELLAWMLADRFVFFGMQEGDRRWGQMRTTRAHTRLLPGLQEELAKLPQPKKVGVEFFALPALGRHLYSAQLPVLLRVCWQQQGQQRTLLALGRFARSARFANASNVPVLIRRWQALERSKALRHSAFYRREARMLFDRAPRGLLLATDAEAWLAPFVRAVDLASPTEVVCAWIPARPGLCSLLFVAVAEARISPEVRARMRAFLAGLGLHIVAEDDDLAGALRIVVFVIENPGDAAPLPEAARIETGLANIVARWEDKARAQVMAQRRFPKRLALSAIRELPPIYAELFSPTQFVADFSLALRTMADGAVHLGVEERAPGVVVRIFSPQPIPLSHLVGVLVHFGLTPIDEVALAFPVGDARVAFAQFACRLPEGLAGLRREERVQLKRAIEAVLNEVHDDDSLNALILRAGLDYERVGALILLCECLCQLYAEARPQAIREMLLRHDRVSAALARWFTARHLPGADAEDEAIARAAFEEQLGTVSTLHDDRWFRALGELVAASVRTNLFVRSADQPLALKLASQRLAGIPEPKPWREIFVHGVHLQGVHLRAGPIARGGIRFSDRAADLRTEILELMATQVVKNGQIVPTGAKGGFVVFGGAGEAFVRRQYRAFIRGLLSVVDQRTPDGRIAAPAGIRSEHDEPDAYLVVAADKGTARFSDDANEEAERAGFWLGDAFASGGRNGYDHKALGITARGAWVVGEHHFSRLGKDIWRDAITAVGIGDPSGDVFGNGMLLNPNIRLIAAFNHRAIFVDPAPDPERAWRERKRLFEQGKDWLAYDRGAISQGGGVFARNAKRIAITEPMRKALGIAAGVSTLSGEELIRAILCAPVDLLYNGGIGTYVKAKAETHEEVRDPANNAVRVDAEDLRCKVVLEGGNLGLTQKARLAFARRGGLINTDAIDNAAGVHISDREVNLKILFATAGVAGTRRNHWLARLSDAVVDACLQANAAQARALSLAERDAQEHRPRFVRLQHRLQQAGLLDAFVAAGLDREQLHLRPALAVLLGQEKNRLQRELTQQGFLHRSLFAEELLLAYFPLPLRRRFADSIRRHPLAAEIAAVQAANQVVNEIGLAAASAIEDMLDRDLASIVEGLLIVDRLFDGARLRTTIWKQAGSADVALELHHALSESVVRAAEELLRLCPLQALSAELVQRLQRSLHRFAARLAPADAGGEEMRARLARTRTLIEAGIAPEAAARWVAIPELAALLAPALWLHLHQKVPFVRALHGMRQLLDALPFAMIDAELRSDRWGESPAHELRRRLLARLANQKLRAASLLQRSPALIPRWKEASLAMRSTLHEAAELTGEERRMKILLVLEMLDDVLHKK